MELIEPLRELFKDEVRELGRKLGLPSEIVDREPFPGPGPRGANRRRGHARSARAVAPRRPYRDGGICVIAVSGRNLWQAFAVLLPLKTVGVMGDGRSYESVIAIRAVESQDGMTADWARLDPGVPRARVEPYHQRNPRRQSRRVRHHLETARHDRMGVNCDRSHPLRAEPDRLAAYR